MLDYLRLTARRQRITYTVIGAFGFSVALLGTGIGGMNNEGVQKFGFPVLVFGVTAIIVGVIWFFFEAVRMRAWADEASARKIPNFTRIDGPGQLPRPGDVDKIVSHPLQ